jgi:hypothetical protein
MKKAVSTLVLLFTILTGYAQYFEGKIVYTNKFTSKMASVSSEQMAATMGTKQEYFIKGGNYKSVVNGTAFKLQVYDNKTNRLYNKLPDTDTLFWLDAATNNEEAISAETRPKKEKVAGVDCDVLVVKTKKTTTTYYFSAKYKVNAALFEKHKYGNWYYFVKKSGALPLKIVMEGPGAVMESTATEIKPMKLDANFFSIGKVPVAQLKK